MKTISIVMTEANSGVVSSILSFWLPSYRKLEIVGLVFTPASRFSGTASNGASSESMRVDIIFGSRKEPNADISSILTLIRLTFRERNIALAPAAVPQETFAPGRS